MPRGRFPTLMVFVTFSVWASMTLSVLSFSLETNTVWPAAGAVSAITMIAAGSSIRFTISVFLP